MVSGLVVSGWKLCVCVCVCVRVWLVQGLGFRVCVVLLWLCSWYFTLAYRKTRSLWTGLGLRF